MAWGRVAGKLSGRKTTEMSPCVPRWPGRPEEFLPVAAIVWPAGPGK